MDIMNDKWIEIGLGFSSYAHNLIDNREQLQKYAKELSWELKEEKKGVTSQNSGLKVYPLNISPKGGKISPAEFGDLSDKIIGFAQNIALSLGKRNNKGILVFENSFYLENLMTAGKKEDVMMVLSRFSILTLRYPLYNRITLEKINKELAKTIFENLAREEINLMDNLKIKFSEYLFRKDEKNKKKKYMERLKNWFGIEID